MSVVQNPIVGRASGKYSSTVFSKWKNKNVIRTKPISFNTSYVASLVSQRSKFKICLALARQITSPLRLTFKKVAVDMTQFNYFMSANINLADSATNEFPNLASQNLKFSSGSLPSLVDIAIDSSNATGCTVSWNSADNGITHAANEYIGFAFFNYTQQKCSIILSEAEFTLKTASPEYLAAAGDIINVFAFIHFSDFSNFSNSQFVGSYTVA